jgi:hypothetical protein
MERLAGRHGRADAYDFVAMCVSHRSKPPHAVVLDQVRRAHSTEREARLEVESDLAAIKAAANRCLATHEDFGCSCDGCSALRGAMTDLLRKARGGG